MGSRLTDLAFLADPGPALTLAGFKAALAELEKPRPPVPCWWDFADAEQRRFFVLNGIAADVPCDGPAHYDNTWPDRQPGEPPVLSCKAHRLVWP